MIDIDEFVQGYLDGILFTESLDFDPTIRPDWAKGFAEDSSLLDYGCSREDFAPEAVAEIRAECEDFIAANEQDLADYCHLRGGVRVPPNADAVKRAELAQTANVHCRADSFGRTYYSAYECAGTDFWLSRNGHGAGFFDRGNEPVFGRLQDAARVYGEANVYFDGDTITTN